MPLDLTTHITVSQIEDPAMLVGYALLLDIATRILVPVARDRFRVMGGIFDVIAGYFNTKLNRDYRSDKELKRRGTIALVIVLLIAYLVGYGLEHFISTHHNGSVLAVLVLFFCFSATRPLSVGWKLFSHLKQKSGQASQSTKNIFSRHLLSERIETSKPDGYRYARFYVEHCVESLCLHVISPIFWFLLPYLFGYTGWIPLVMSVALQQSFTVWSPKITHPSTFAQSAQVLHTIVHLVPARIAAVVIWISGFFGLEASPFRAIQTVLKQSRAYNSFILNWPMALMTGALNVVVEAGHNDWVGPDKATAKLTWIDVRRTLLFYGMSLIITALILSAIIYLSLGYSRLV